MKIQTTIEITTIEITTIEMDKTTITFATALKKEIVGMATPVNFHIGGSYDFSGNNSSNLYCAQWCYVN
jgi:hypothetical protein